MKLEEIIELWKKDCVIDQTDLSNEAVKCPLLHSKYYEIFLQEDMLMKKKMQEYYTLYKFRVLYYTGKLSDEELHEAGLEAFQLRVNKDNLVIFIQADPELQKVLLQVDLQKDKVEFLKDIIKSIHNRNFNIKSAIDFLRWTSGS